MFTLGSAGLVKGASKGEGLGNKFLSHIREVDAIIHMVRCFDSTDIIHVEGSVDPIRDIETIDLELVLSDLEIVERAIDRTVKAAKSDKKLLEEACEKADFVFNLAELTVPKIPKNLWQGISVLHPLCWILCKSITTSAL